MSNFSKWNMKKKKNAMPFCCELTSFMVARFGGNQTGSDNNYVHKFAINRSTELFQFSVVHAERSLP